MTRETLDLAAVDLPAPRQRRRAPDDRPFLPFAASDKRPTPDFLPLGGQRVVRQTSSTHGPDGYITADPDLISANQQRLHDKVAGAVERFTHYEEIATPGADTLLVSYGVTARAARAAVRQANAAGARVSLLVLKTLWPVPERLIREKAAAVARVVVVEMNLGQYVREVERLAGGKPVRFVGRMNGELISPNLIAQEVADG